MPYDIRPFPTPTKRPNARGPIAIAFVVLAVSLAIAGMVLFAWMVLVFLSGNWLFPNK